MDGFAGGGSWEGGGSGVRGGGSCFPLNDVSGLNKFLISCLYIFGCFVVFICMFSCGL